MISDDPSDAKVDLDPNDPTQVEAFRKRLDAVSPPKGGGQHTARHVRASRSRSKPQPQPEQPQSSRRVTYTKIQADQQLHLIEELVMRGIRSTRKLQQAIFQHLGIQISSARVRVLVERIQQRWSFEDTQFRAIAKASAERRIVTYLSDLWRKAQGTQQEAGKPALYSQIHKFEELLSKIQGTQEPVQLSVNAHATEAMMSVIGSMDEGTMKALIEEQWALEQAYKKGLFLSQHHTACITGEPTVYSPEPRETDDDTLVDDNPNPSDDAFTRATRLVQEHRTHG